VRDRERTFGAFTISKYFCFNLEFKEESKEVFVKLKFKGRIGNLKGICSDLEIIRDL